MNILIIIINGYILISLKPYILVALLPGILMWTTFEWNQKIKNRVVRALAGPGLIIFGLLAGVGGLSLLGGKLGAYTDVKSIASQAQVIQQDLTRSEQYGKNYYDIGKFDASMAGMISKAPISIFTALFRPFIFEARSFTMIMSGIENLIILIFFIIILFRVGLFKLVKIVSTEPLVFFSLLFAIIFAFSVGIASANFGAMVRYRIPCMIFFIPSLFILYERMKDIKSERIINLTQQ